MIIAALSVIVLKKNPDLRDLLAWLAIKYSAILIVIIGTLYGFMTLFRKTRTLSGAFTIYVILIIVLVLLFQATSKIPPSANIKPVAIKTRDFLTLIIIASGLLCWHISIVTPNLPQFEAWIISFDVVLAHVVITIPLLQWTYYTIKKIIRVIGSVLLELLRHIEGTKVRFITSLNIYEGAIYPGFATSVSLGVVWLLLIKTVDLQNALFGNYSPLLGWEISTSYRFSFLFEQLNTFFGNQALATIFGFAAFAISLTLGFSSLLNSIKNIGDDFKKATDDHFN